MATDAWWLYRLMAISTRRPHGLMAMCARHLNGLMAINAWQLNGLMAMGAWALYGLGCYWCSQAIWPETLKQLWPCAPRDAIYTILLGS